MADTAVGAKMLRPVVTEIRLIIVRVQRQKCKMLNTKNEGGFGVKEIDVNVFCYNCCCNTVCLCQTL